MIETKDLSFSQKSDPYEPGKPFSHKPIDYNSLEAFNHSSESDFLDISKLAHHNPLGDSVDPDLEPQFSKDTFHANTLSPIPRSLLNLSASPNIFFAGHNGGFSHYNNSSFHHNMNSNHSKESFGLGPFRKLHTSNVMLDDYYANYESNAENSNNNTMKFQDHNGDSSSFQMHFLWGNDPSKTPKSKVHAHEVPDFLPKTMSFAPNFNGFDDNEGDQENGFHYQIGGTPSQKIKQEVVEAKKSVNVKIEAKEAKNIATPPSAQKQEHVSDYQPKSGSALKTPTNKRRIEELKTTCKSTPISKVEMSSDKKGVRNIFDDEDEDDNEDGDAKQRSSRGLRVLSVKVRDIVIEKQNTSYKEVADCLIDEFNMKYRAKKPCEAKDVQNVKRRVYDALNVLIAADILKKDGKAVHCDETLANLGPQRREKLKEEKAELVQRISEIKRRNKGKVDLIQDLVAKYSAIKSLKERNKSRVIVDGSDEMMIENKAFSVGSGIEVKNEAEEAFMTPTKGRKKGAKSNNNTANNTNNKKGKNVKIEEKSEAQSESMETDFATPVRITKDEMIRFPFFGLTYTTEFNQMNLKTNDSKTRLSIESANPLTVYGDIDLVLKMRSNPITKRFFEENIPHDIHKYITKTYKENLV